MSIVSVGECDRCLVHVNDTPGLGYADRQGRFSYCVKCLSETGLGYRVAREKGFSMREATWLEDVLENCSLIKTYFFLKHAESDWYKLKNVPSCGECSVYQLKTGGCKCK